MIKSSWYVLFINDYCSKIFVWKRQYDVFVGQKKLGKVITPDPWKSGARNTTGIFCS